MRRLVAGALALAVLLAAVGLLWAAGAVELPWEDRYGAATVTLQDADGTRLATVDARVADSRKERVTGLGETTSLPPGEGMLFVHRATGTHTYVMRNMSFPLDIVFVVPCEGDCPAGADGRITTIHGADVPPPDESSPQYRGRGKWVLEVPRGYTDDRGVEVGDYVTIRYRDGTADRNP